MSTQDRLQYIINYYENVELNALAFLHDADFNVLYASRKFCELVSLTQDDLIGKRMGSLSNKYFQQNKQETLAFCQHFIKQGFDHCIGVRSVLVPPDGKKKIFTFEYSHIKELGYLTKMSELQIGLVGDIAALIHQLASTNIKPQLKSQMYRNQNKVSLSEEEEIICFLLTLGKRYKTIANIMSKVYNVEFTDLKIKRIINVTLFDKFNCFVIDELIYKFFNNSMMHAVPAKLISLGVTGLLSVSVF